jgi:hypothetical protein
MPTQGPSNLRRLAQRSGRGSAPLRPSEPQIALRRDPAAARAPFLQLADRDFLSSYRPEDTGWACCLRPMPFAPEFGFRPKYDEPPAPALNQFSVCTSPSNRREKPGGSHDPTLVIKQNHRRAYGQVGARLKHAPPKIPSTRGIATLVGAG